MLQSRSSRPPTTMTSNNNNMFSRKLYHHKPEWSKRPVRIVRVQWAFLSRHRKTQTLCCLLAVLVSVSFSCWILDLLFQSQLYPTTNTNNQFSVVINSYQRPQELKDAIHHYATRCSKHVDQVFVVWSDDQGPPPFRNHRHHKVPVTFVPVKNSLNSRFLPLEPASHAIFMVDDDVRVHCSSLERAFVAWQARPMSMVGFYPRLAEQHLNSFAYHGWPMVFLRQQTNLVLTKASFLHKHYLDLYSDPVVHPPEILDYVDRHFTCEDIAMSLLVANATRTDETGVPALPIYVEGRVTDRGIINGISANTGHMARRSQCLYDLVAIYKQHGWSSPITTAFPLREASFDQHFPGFWWQARPSNFFEWFAVSCRTSPRSTTTRTRLRRQ